MQLHSFNLRREMLCSAMLRTALSSRNGQAVRALMISRPVLVLMTLSLLASGAQGAAESMPPPGAWDSPAPVVPVVVAFAAPAKFVEVETNAGSHYGDPCAVAGCNADREQAVSVLGVDGSSCSPDCDTAACPKDVPAGSTAQPYCALTAPSGVRACVLVCSPLSPALKDQQVADDGCGAGASCKPIQGMGICTYNDCGTRTAIKQTRRPATNRSILGTAISQVCTGNSTRLAQNQCDAWGDLYTALGGDEWSPKCKNTQRDPCSCRNFDDKNSVCNTDGTVVNAMCVMRRRRRRRAVTAHARSAAQ
jgi:hypothetical protein